MKLSKVCLLDKRTWMMTSFQIFDYAFKNHFLVWKITHQPRDWINGVTNRHYITRGISGTNFKFIQYPEVEILRGSVAHMNPTPLYNYYSRKKVFARGVNRANMLFVLFFLTLICKLSCLWLAELSGSRRNLPRVLLNHL